MTTFDDLTADSVFRIAKGAKPSPLVIDVSRSGTRYPPEFMPPAPFNILHTKLSPYVERVVLPSTAEGATVLTAQFPPSFVDPNRPIDDIDPDIVDGQWKGALNPLKASLQSGSGLIHTLGSNNDPLYQGRLPAADIEARISHYYTPYHATLAELLSAKKQQFGIAFQLSCHSMSSIGPKDGQPRPDICLGDLDGASASPDYIEIVGSVFRDRGLGVAFNKPFRGNELLRRHADPGNRVFSLQIEMRRSLYIDEKTRVLNSGLPALQACFIKIAAAIRQHAGSDNAKRAASA